MLLAVNLVLVTKIGAQTDKPADTLTFQITGFEDNTGQVLVQLFRKEDKVPVKPFMAVVEKIMDHKAEVQITGLTYGEYAAIVVHDKNANGIIDHQWGFPDEPLGYPNNWGLSVFSGMPTFANLKFFFSQSNNILNINMKEWYRHF